MGNPLVAEEKDSTTAISGITILEAGKGLRDGIESGDWATTAMGAIGVGMEALAFVADPFGSILAGDPDKITAHSETWGNIAKEVGEVSKDLSSQLKADIQSWAGPGADAYRRQADDVTKVLDGAAQACDGAASGVKTAGEVVAAVRMLVRDIIAGHTARYTLDAEGRTLARDVDGASLLQQAFGPSGLLTQQLSSGTVPVQRRGFDYQADGSLAGTRDEVSGSTSYARDVSGRIVSVSTKDGREELRYDAAGHLIAWSGGTGLSDEYDALGRRTRHSEVTPDGVQVWEYAWTGERLTGLRTPTAADGTTAMTRWAAGSATSASCRTAPWASRPASSGTAPISSNRSTPTPRASATSRRGNAGPAAPNR